MSQKMQREGGRKKNIGNSGQTNMNSLAHVTDITIHISIVLSYQFYM